MSLGPCTPGYVRADELLRQLTEDKNPCFGDDYPSAQAESAALFGQEGMRHGSLTGMSPTAVPKFLRGRFYANYPPECPFAGRFSAYRYAFYSEVAGLPATGKHTLEFLMYAVMANQDSVHAFNPSQIYLDPIWQSFNQARALGMQRGATSPYNPQNVFNIKDAKTQFALDQVTRFLVENNGNGNIFSVAPGWTKYFSSMVIGLCRNELTNILNDEMQNRLMYIDSLKEIWESLNSQQQESFQIYISKLVMQSLIRSPKITGHQSGQHFPVFLNALVHFPVPIIYWVNAPHGVALSLYNLQNQDSIVNGHRFEPRYWGPNAFNLEDLLLIKLIGLYLFSIYGIGDNPTMYEIDTDTSGIWDCGLQNVAQNGADKASNSMPAVSIKDLRTWLGLQHDIPDFAYKGVMQVLNIALQQKRQLISLVN